MIGGILDIAKRPARAKPFVAQVGCTLDEGSRAGWSGTLVVQNPRAGGPQRTGNGTLARLLPMRANLSTACVALPLSRNGAHRVGRGIFRTLREALGAF